MGSELIPFATQEEALSFAHDHNGQKVLSFDEITEAMVKNL
jgi:nitrous oxide reductase accessory protein NosL